MLHGLLVLFAPSFREGDVLEVGSFFRHSISNYRKHIAAPPAARQLQ